MTLIFQALVFTATGLQSGCSCDEAKNSFPKNVRNICRNYLSTNPKKQSSHSQHTEAAAVFASLLLHVSQPPYLGNLPEFGSWYLYTKEKGFICLQASLCLAGGWDLASTICLEDLLPSKQHYNRTERKQMEFRDRWVPSGSAYKLEEITRQTRRHEHYYGYSVIVGLL